MIWYHNKENSMKRLIAAIVALTFLSFVGCVEEPYDPTKTAGPPVMPDSKKVKIDAASGESYLYDGGAGAFRAGTNVSVSDDGDYITVSASLAGGAVDTSGTLNGDEIAVMHDLDTIKSLTEAEFKTAYSLTIGTDVLAPVAGNDPVLQFDETDGTDWEVRVDDTGNSLELGSSTAGVGDNVELEIDEDGDIHVTGDAYIEGALAEVGGSNPTVRFDETDGTDWEIRVDDTGNTLEIGSSAAGVGDNVELEIDEDGDIHVTKDVIATGDVYVTGDDIFATTNTAGAIWVGDATNYNPVAVGGDATLASDGTVAVVDFVLTEDADVGDYDITSVDQLQGVDNTVYVDLGSTDTMVLESDVNIAANTPDVIQYEAVNDANPEIRQGSADAEESIVQTVFDSGGQTVDYLLIQTQTADATADEGRVIIQVDEAQVAQFDDNGLELGVVSTLDGVLSLHSDAGHTTSIAPAGTTTESVAYILPPADGTASQYLKTDGSATLSWGDPSGAGTVTEVGADDGGGEVFTEASTAPTGGDALWFEGTSSNTNEIKVTSANPDADYTVTLSNATGSVFLTDGTNTDHAVVRSDGTGSLGQTSGVIIDDSDNVSAVASLSFGSDPADAGTIRLENADDIMFEADAAGTDVNALTVDSSEIVQIASSGAAGVVITPATTVTGALTLSSTLSDGTATLTSGAWSGVSTIGVSDAITLSDGATVDQSANNYVTFAENSDTAEVYFGGTDVDLVWSDGVLNLRNAEDAVNAIVEIEGKDANERGELRVLSDGDDKYIAAYHDDTDGIVAASSGDVVIAPDGDTDDYAMVSTATNITSISVTGGTGTLGTAAAEWNEIYLGDASVVKFQADQSVTLTSSATGLEANLDIGLPDGEGIEFGTSNDVKASWDGTNQDFTITTADYGTATTDNAMVQIVVDSGANGMTSDKEVFEVLRGSTELLALDEDGDLSVAGVITPAPSTDPYFIFNEANAGDTDYWLAVDGNQDGSSNDSIFIGTGTTPGSNSVWEMNSAGDVINSGSQKASQVLLEGGTYDTTIGPGTPTESVTYQWPLADGSNGYVMTTDGSGTISWAENSPTPGGDTEDVQYNTGSGQGGEDAFAYNATNNTLSLTQAASNPTLQVGDGSFSWTHTPQAGIEGVLEIDGNVFADADITVGDDIYSLSDSAVHHYGAGSDVTVTHVADTGLTIKQLGLNTDDHPVVLTLQTAEADIAADDVLGAIYFQAPDEGTGTDAILVAGGVEVVSEGDFSASNNATKMSFKLGSSETATEKAYLTSSGNMVLDGNVVIANAGNIGSASDTDAIAIASDGSVTLTVQEIADNHVITIDDADAANGDFARFTAAGIEGRSPAEVVTQLEDLAWEYGAIAVDMSAATVTLPAISGAIIADSLTLENSETITNAVDDTFLLSRDDSGTVTVTAADDDANAALTVVAGGTGTLTLGNATNTDISIVTDGVNISEAELIILDGVTSSTAQINYLDAADGETGSGSVVFDDTPALITPNIGAATGTGLDASGTVSANLFTPDAADGANIGGTSLEFSDVYLADGSIIYLGDDQDVSITHVADTGILVNLEVEVDGTLDADGIVALGDGGDNFSVASDGIDIDTSGNITNGGTIGSGAITSTGAVEGTSLTDGTATMSSGSLSAVVGVDASGTVSANLFTPDAADGADIGSAALEFSDIYLAASSVIYGENDQGNTLTSSATGWTANLNLAATTYGSDGTISDAELLTLDNGATTEILVGGGAGSAPVWTTAEGTGAPVRAGTPTLTTPNIGAATGTSLAVTGAITGLASRGADITANTSHDTTECHSVVYVFTEIATVTLDAAADAGYGATVCYRVRDAEVATIDVDDAEKINLDGTALAAGYTVDSSGAAGEFVCLMSTTDADGSGTDGWETWGMNGTWADGGAS